jgi:acyl dehydratase
MTTPPPPDGIWHHEDFAIGQTMTLGSRHVTKDEIIAIARVYDPQPIHLDEEAAKHSMVGGLCASGFHTCGLLMRILCDEILNHSGSLGSPGIDEVKWMKPVRPGDTLAARLTCTEKRNLASRPDVGASKMLFELLNQNQDVVMSWASNQFIRRRHPGHEAPSSTARTHTAPLINNWDLADAPSPSRTGNFFEDRHVGEVYDLGRHTFTRDDIIAFAEQFDPQPFHLTEEAGRKSLFGALAASGWHTAAIFVQKNVAWRQAFEAEIRNTGNPVAQWGPSPGIKGVSWMKPVLAGDTLEFRGRTTEKIELKSRPNRGLIVSETQGRNQRGEIVFRIGGQIFVERRSA